MLRILITSLIWKALSLMATRLPRPLPVTRKKELVEKTSSN